MTENNDAKTLEDFYDLIRKENPELAGELDEPRRTPVGDRAHAGIPLLRAAEGTAATGVGAARGGLSLPAVRADEAPRSGMRRPVPRGARPGAVSRQGVRQS